MLDRHLSRRDVLLGAAALVAASAVPGLLTAKEADPFGGFTLAVQSYTFRKFNLEQCVKKTHDLGLKHIEFFRGHIPTDSTPEQIKSVLKLLKDHDLTAVAFGVEPFSKDHDANKQRFEFGAALGVTVVLVPGLIGPVAG